MIKQLYLLALLRPVSALVPSRGPPASAIAAQQPLNHQQHSDFQCHLPPALDPAAKDSLPSATHLFSSQRALLRQVRRHQAVVRVPSICYDDLGSFEDDERWEPFYELQHVLAEMYPFVHSQSKLEKINTFGLVYTIHGTDEHLQPILLTAHQDVVPVGDDDSWTYPPFSAHWDGEYLWGRGASDDKNSLTAIMTTMETLLSNRRWRPKRTVILAFGFDEECTGDLGSGHLAKHLRRQYGRNGLAMILDEGGQGVKRMGDVIYALPAVYEKGYLDVGFRLETPGGHSSTPVPHTAIGIMAEVVTALEASPFEPALLQDGPVHRHLLCQARYSPDAQPRLTELLRRGDLVGAARFLADSDLTARYLLQTSQAVDVIRGGHKINALPEVTTLGVNYRIAPQDSIPGVQHILARRVQDVVAKYGIKVRAFEGDKAYETYVASSSSSSTPDHHDHKAHNGTLILQAKQAADASPVSPSSGPIWDVFAGTIRHAMGSRHETVVPTGETMTGNTDMRQYLGLSPHIYRWTPINRTNTPGVHTVDERVRMVDHMGMVRFYYDLVRNFDGRAV
ncbi:hypothetical protein E4U55_002462 [Claviceps digitariae]|nr:hypothetical protein E4U55_002462 [Claviceps digitariae]